jgi:hypothetical protein
MARDASESAGRKEEEERPEREEDFGTGVCVASWRGKLVRCYARSQ